MRLSLLLGWRSFVRHRRRSVITVVAVSLSLAMMIMFVGLADDSHARMAQMGIRLGAGHVLVQGKGYQEEQTLERLVADPDRVVRIAKALHHVKQAVVRVRSTGLLTAGELSSAVMLGGVEPHIEPHVSDIAAEQKRTSGAYIRRRADMDFPKGPADIYVGDELANSLKVTVGDRVVLTVAAVNAARTSSAAFLVRGVFHTGLNELDGGYVEIPIEEAQQILKIGKQASQVALLLDDLDSSDGSTAAMREALGQDAQAELEVLSWKDALRQLHEAILLDDLGLYLMMSVIFIIVAIGIFNTVLMSVSERTREFGVMMAVGTTKWRLFSIIMAEAAVLALVSAAIGLALGLIGHSQVAAHGIDVMALAGGEYEFAGIAFSGRIYSRLTPWVVCKWTLVVMGMVLTSAVVPALRAMRLKPVEAMRHV